MARALILVDIQNDFMESGALPVPDGDAVARAANALMSRFDFVVATQDYHPRGHESFASSHHGRSPGDVIDLHGVEQVLWPDHCVLGTSGADFTADLDESSIDAIFRKGTHPDVDSYSGFFDNLRRHATGLDEWLSARDVREVFVVGVATDYCVRATALDAVSLGYETTVIEDGCRGVELTVGDVRRALEEMRAAGVAVVRSEALLPPIDLGAQTPESSRRE